MVSTRARWTGFIVAASLVAGSLAFASITDPAPDFVGQKMSDFNDIAGFEVVYDGQRAAAPGTVVRQSPAAGVPVPKDIRFVLTFAGVERVVLENPIGDADEEVRKRISAAGLTLGQVSYSLSETATPGSVLAASWSPQAYLQPGDRIDLVIAKRPTVSVPRVVGMAADKAKTALASSGLRYRMLGRAPHGRVLGQSPKAGQSVAKDTSVVLTALEIQPDTSTWDELVAAEEGDVIYVRVKYVAKPELGGPPSRIRSGEKSWDGKVHGDGLSLEVYGYFRIWTPMPFAKGMVRYGDVVALRVDSVSSYPGKNMEVSVEEVWRK